MILKVIPYGTRKLLNKLPAARGLESMSSSLRQSESTVLRQSGEILGKPETAKSVEEMMQNLSRPASKVLDIILKDPIIKSIVNIRVFKDVGLDLLKKRHSQDLLQQGEPIIDVVLKSIYKSMQRKKITPKSLKEGVSRVQKSKEWQNFVDGVKGELEKPGSRDVMEQFKKIFEGK